MKESHDGRRSLRQKYDVSYMFEYIVGGAMSLRRWRVGAGDASDAGMDASWTIRRVFTESGRGTKPSQFLLSSSGMGDGYIEPHVRIHRRWPNVLVVQLICYPLRQPATRDIRLKDVVRCEYTRNYHGTMLCQKLVAVSTNLFRKVPNADGSQPEIATNRSIATPELDIKGQFTDRTGPSHGAAGVGGI